MKIESTQIKTNKLSYVISLPCNLPDLQDIQVDTSALDERIKALRLNMSDIPIFTWDRTTLLISKHLLRTDRPLPVSPLSVSKSIEFLFYEQPDDTVITYKEEKVPIFDDTPSPFLDKNTGEVRLLCPLLRYETKQVPVKSKKEFTVTLPSIEFIPANRIEYPFTEYCEQEDGTITKQENAAVFMSGRAGLRYPRNGRQTRTEFTAPL